MSRLCRGVSLASMAGFISAAAAGPVPMGESTTTVSYETASGPVSFSDTRNYLGAAPTDATNLGEAPNIRAFNSSNRFGRRTFLATSNPIFAHVISEDETLVAHPFFKADTSSDYFPGIVEGSTITVAVEGIHFSEPVFVVGDSFLAHTLWQSSQVDELEHPYHHLHNQHTASQTFRDLDDFLMGGVFAEHPVADHVLGDVVPTFTGEGTDTLGFQITFPYELLRSLEEEGHGTVPPGLPAPHGFLEPFHFHFEYLVVPEPSVITMLALGLAGLFALRRRPHSVSAR